MVHVGVLWLSAFVVTACSWNVVTGVEIRQPSILSSPEISGNSESKTNTLLGSGVPEKPKGSNNVFIGYRAGRDALKVDDATIIGANAGSGLTSGDGNTCVGSNSGRSINKGAENTLVGRDAGMSLAEGDRNTCFGSSTCGSLEQGTDNTAMGHGAMSESTHGDMNTAVGLDALRSIDGVGNAAFGAFAGLKARGAYCNSFVGTGAGFKTKSGSFNTFLGALAGCGTGGSGDSDGSANTYVGFGSGYSNQDGSYNVMVGSYANTVELTPSESEAVCLKPDAAFDDGEGWSVDYTAALGSNALVQGQYSVALGYGTRALADKSVAIGPNAVASKPNSLVIGGMAEEDRLSVGIGTDAPNDKASIDLSQDTGKGLLLNRWTTDSREAVRAGEDRWTIEEAGSIVFDTDLGKTFLWDGAEWTEFADAASSKIGAIGYDRETTTLTISQGDNIVTTVLDVTDDDSDPTNELITNTAFVPSTNSLLIRESGTDHTVDLSPLRVVTFQASVEDVWGGKVFYGFSSTSGFSMPRDGRLLGFSIAMDKKLSNKGDVTVEVVLHDEEVGDALVLSKGELNKNGAVEFSSGVWVESGDVVSFRITANGDVKKDIKGVPASLVLLAQQ